jgi:hypothetical protein
MYAFSYKRWGTWMCPNCANCALFGLLSFIGYLEKILKNWKNDYFSLFWRIFNDYLEHLSKKVRLWVLEIVQSTFGSSISPIGSKNALLFLRHEDIFERLEATIDCNDGILFEIYDTLCILKGFLCFSRWTIAKKSKNWSPQAKFYQKYADKSLKYASK